MPPPLRLSLDEDARDPLAPIATAIKGARTRLMAATDISRAFLLSLRDTVGMGCISLLTTNPMQPVIKGPTDRRLIMLSLIWWRGSAQGAAAG